MIRIMNDKDKKKADAYRKISEGIAYVQGMNIEGWAEERKW